MTPLWAPGTGTAFSGPSTALSAPGDLCEEAPAPPLMEGWASALCDL